MELPSMRSFNLCNLMYKHFSDLWTVIRISFDSQIWLAETVFFPLVMSSVSIQQFQVWQISDWQQSQFSACRDVCRDVRGPVYFALYMAWYTTVTIHQYINMSVVQCVMQCWLWYTVSIAVLVRCQLLSVNSSGVGIFMFIPDSTYWCSVESWNTPRKF